MPTVYEGGKKPRQVKNLRWLHDHWKEIKELGFTKWDSGYTFNAFLHDKTFIAHYQSYGVFLDYADRSIYYGVPLRVVDQTRGGICLAEGPICKGMKPFRVVDWR